MPRVVWHIANISMDIQDSVGSVDLADIVVELLREWP